MQWLADYNSLFLLALLLMALIGIVEILGGLLGLSGSSALDSLIPEANGLDVEHGVFSKLWSWLRVGEVPLLIIVIFFLLYFGLIGIGLQSMSTSLLGWAWPQWLLAPGVLALSLPCVRASSGLMQKIIPKVETSAVSADSLLGRVATVTLGDARLGLPAQARVKDQHGYQHYIQVEPDSTEEILPQGSQVLLISRDQGLYKAIMAPNPSLIED